MNEGFTFGNHWYPRRVMARQTFVHFNGRLMPKGEVPDEYFTGRNRGVIDDTMAPVQSMVDGKKYDSKSALRRHYRAAGVYEVGNDPIGRSEWNHAPKEA